MFRTSRFETTPLLSTSTCARAGEGDKDPPRSSVCGQRLGSFDVDVQNSIESQKKASYCCVRNCRSNSLLNPSLGFFRLPSDSQRSKEWLERIQRVKSKMKKMLVCEKHFESCYVNKNNYRRTRLVMHAVPTLHLPAPPASAPAAAAAAAASASSTRRAPPKVKRIRPRSRVTEKNAIKRIEAFVHRSRHPGNANRLIAEIIALHKRFSDKKDGWIVTDQFKFFALKLYCLCPNTYKIMQPLLCLPTISTLYRYYIPYSSNICENLIIALTIKVATMTAEQKECAVCIGTREVRPNLHYDDKKDEVVGFHDVAGSQRPQPAGSALLVAVRGLYHDWKQAISCSFLALHQEYEDVRAYIVKVISRMFEIGLTVRVLISDVETDFIGLTEQMEITSQAPFFNVNDSKVYYLDDPVHLVKNVRDYFTTSNFCFNEKIAKWEHIAQCYDHECKKPLRLAPRLTSHHITHTHLQSEKDKVELASDVFSKQTAAAVSAYAQLKVIDEPVAGTVDWILLMNKLFNLLNFTSYVKNDDPSTLLTGKEEQLEFIEEILTILQDLRVVDALRGSDVTNDAKIISRLKASLTAIVSLHQDLSSIYKKFPTFMSRDCLDLFFDKVHKKHGRLPTCRQVKLSLTSKTPIFNMFQGKNKKIEDTLEIFIHEAVENSAIVMVYERAEPSAVSPYEECTAGLAEDALALPAQHALQQLAAFLLYQACQRHSDCERTQSYAFQGASNQSTTVILTIDSQDQEEHTVLVMVPAEFIEFVELMEITLKLYFETEYQRSAVKGLVEHLLSDDVTFSMPCKCFPLDYIKYVYIKYRFNMILDYNNEEYEKPSQECKNYFVVNEL